jgi:hypothetical protein
MASSIYRNWQAANEGKPSQVCFEFPLFSDTRIVGEVPTGLGPYQLINNVPGPDNQTTRPTIILRAESHLDDEILTSMDKTDDEQYHGGFIQDEVAALVSLCLGCRVKAGGATRLFDGSTEQRGRPVSWAFDPDPVLPKPARRSVIPWALEEKNLMEILRLKQLLLLNSAEAMALIRAARFYQEGLWIVEQQPELSWLMFVSAVETIAHSWRMSNETPLERMRASRPKLETLLREKGDESFVERVAKEIAPYMGATKKFVDFILEFLPPPPQSRPEEYYCVAWTEPSMKNAMTKIYQYRSQALHGGKPFPAPLCEAPRKFDGKHFEEKPSGLAVRIRGGTWLAKDLPMYLHLFEYICRNAILQWWDGTYVKRTDSGS